ncbi:MAG: sugar phosphate nucleotidyltransferase [Chromatiales bacterium]
MSEADSAIAVVLAIGQGSELSPLTATRSSAAVPFGGLYRTIDFTLTNCVHSGLRRVLVLTQYMSHSLHKHLRDGWSVFNPEIGEFVTAVPPQMHGDHYGYTGATDALRQNTFLLERNHGSVVVVLSGDYVYRMDYAAMIDFHRRHGAGVTVPCLPEGDPQRDPSLPVLGVNDADEIVSVHAQSAGDSPRHHASMGIYVFDKDLLLERLAAPITMTPGSLDMGIDLLPGLVGRARMMVYRFGGTSGRVSQDRYWRRLSSLDVYYQANMDLLRHEPPLDLYQADWPIRTYQPQSPPARTVPGRSSNEGIFVNSIVAGGSVIAGGGVNHSILFPRVLVEDAATVENSILFAGVQVGEGAVLHNCIVEKYVQIPAGASIGVDADLDRVRFVVTEKGIVVVPKRYQFDAVPTRRAARAGL